MSCTATSSWPPTASAKGLGRHRPALRLIPELEALLGTHIDPLIDEALKALGSLARLVRWEQRARA
jgi:hypothetical protein